MLKRQPSYLIEAVENGRNSWKLNTYWILPFTTDFSDIYQNLNSEVDVYPRVGVPFHNLTFDSSRCACACARVTPRFYFPINFNSGFPVAHYLDAGSSIFRLFEMFQFKFNIGEFPVGRKTHEYFNVENEKTRICQPDKSEIAKFQRVNVGKCQLPKYLSKCIPVKRLWMYLGEN